MHTAILFLIFNRPEITQRVFEQIRIARPARLYIACDGPRNDQLLDVLQVKKTREVVKNIDWPCKVLHLYRQSNLGCKVAVRSAIDWFFESEEEGIILEDDCLPASDFFTFCAKMLKKYRHAQRVMMISGTNYLSLSTYTDKSYFFSEYFAIWGWATWKRAWQKYESNMASWPVRRASGFMAKKYSEKFQQRYFTHLFDQVYTGNIDTWDIQWFYTCLKNSGVALVPSVNLISNIGRVGTHTGGDNRNNNLPTAQLGIVHHPDKIIVAHQYDLDLYNAQFKSSIGQTFFLQSRHMTKAISVGYTILHLLRMQYTHQIVKNVGNKQHRKRALISYLTLPFTNPVARYGTAHQNYFQVVQIAHILGEYGYTVDCIDYHSAEVRFTEKYDLVIDLHPTDSPIYQEYLNKNAKRIAYLTGSNPSFSNAAEKERIDRIARERGVVLTPRRQVRPISKQIENFDAVLLMGNSYTRQTFTNEFKMPKTFMIPNTYQKLGYAVSHKSPKNFLFLGGVGQVHKGLDLVLEAFKQHPSTTLYVCSPFEKESDFVKTYMQELYHTSNIIPVGKVDIASNKFQDLIDCCGYVILPSCSEANAGSVITCMGGGLIPIITKECGIDSRYQIGIDALKVSDLIHVIHKASVSPISRLKEQSEGVYRETQRQHSPICYTMAIRTALRAIV